MTHAGGYEQCSLLGCNRGQLGDSPMFQRSISLPSSWWKIKPSKMRQQPVFGNFLLCLLFDSEDGGDMLLRNVGLSHSYQALQPKRPNSSGFVNIFDDFRFQRVNQCRSNLMCSSVASIGRITSSRV
jgi:hypothetical protein